MRATLANGRQRGMFDRVAALRHNARRAEIDRRPPQQRLAVGALDAALIEGAGLQSSSNAPGAQWAAPVADRLRPYVMRGLRTPYGTAGVALGAAVAALAGRLNSSIDGVPQGPDVESFPAAPPRTPIATGLPIADFGKAEHRAN